MSGRVHPMRSGETRAHVRQVKARGYDKVKHPLQDVVRIDVPIGSLTELQRRVLAVFDGAPLKAQDVRRRIVNVWGHAPGVCAIGSSMAAMSYTRRLLRYQAAPYPVGYSLTLYGEVVRYELPEYRKAIKSGPAVEIPF